MLQLLLQYDQVLHCGALRWGRHKLVWNGDCGAPRELFGSWEATAATAAVAAAATTPDAAAAELGPGLGSGSGAGAWLLFDVEADPTERRPLACAADDPTADPAAGDPAADIGLSAEDRARPSGERPGGAGLGGASLNGEDGGEPCGTQHWAAATSSAPPLSEEGSDSGAASGADQGAMRTLLASMRRSLAAHGRRTAPAVAWEVPGDPNASPALHGGSWVPWREPQYAPAPA